MEILKKAFSAIITTLWLILEAKALVLQEGYSTLSRREDEGGVFSRSRGGCGL